MSYTNLSRDAEYILDVMRLWIASEQSGKPLRERRCPTIHDLGSAQDGIYRTDFPASRIRQAIGELFGAGMIDVFIPSEYDVNGPQWRPTTPEQRRTL